MERAAARFWNYTLGEWLIEDSVVKSHVIADYLENNLRSAYDSETTRAASKKNSGEVDAPSVGSTFAGFRKFK